MLCGCVAPTLPSWGTRLLSMSSDPCDFVKLCCFVSFTEQGGTYSPYSRSYVCTGISQATTCLPSISHKKKNDCIFSSVREHSFFYFLTLSFRQKLFFVLSPRLELSSTRILNIEPCTHVNTSTKSQHVPPCHSAAYQPPTEQLSPRANI